MELDYIMALGNFLQYYNSDLDYILNFQRFRDYPINSDDQILNLPGTFKSFINEFRVARNVDKTKTKELLELTLKWTKGNDYNNVDDFAELLNECGITHGKVMTSLASKILFLNDPWSILPIDNLVRKAVDLKGNVYKDYSKKVKVFKSKHQIEIEESLETVKEHTKIIEKPFNGQIRDLKTIRQNRFIDKILWIKGQKM